ncbi:autotransporter domain-containing protein [Sinorhizobium medicae]|nr:autotransporter domain-containing protein [Sinorhizobium medicae]MDX0673067.1 autotransporter domain-containing protein [Sinorhizobium medicae]MDX0710303.1 autotransporter domain-containing protein [Sinorhizobium medicae]
MRMKAVIPVSCACLLVFGETNAQTVPLRHHFETYSQALRILLGAGDEDCKFVSDPEDPNLFPGPIGPNLSRHCRPDETNLSGGSVMGGSLSSLQSTRTVSQFDVSRRRSEECDPSKDPDCRSPESDTISNYFYQGNLSGNVFSSVLADGEGMLNANVLIPFDGFSVFGQVGYQNYHQSITIYEPAWDVDTFSADLGATWNISNDSILGFKGTYSKGDGSYSGPETVFIRGEGFDIGTLPVNYEQECGVSNGGALDTDEFGGSAFYQTQLLDNGFFAAEIGFSKGHQKYHNSLCTIDVAIDFTNPPSNLGTRNTAAGIISGDPDYIGLSADIHTGYDWDISGVTIGPRFSLNTWWKSIDAYAESEAAGNRQTVPITGAGLRYEEQDISSVQTRIGLAVSKPLVLNTLIVVPFIQLDYIHEFANDQRTIRASFVEDRRPNPFSFTFKSNPPDRDFFEIRSGIVAEIFSGGVAYLDGRAILGHDLVENYGVKGGLRIAF